MMYIKKTDQCKHAKLSYSLGAVIVHLIVTRAAEHGLYAFQLLAQELFHTVCVPLEDA